MSWELWAPKGMGRPRHAVECKGDQGLPDGVCFSLRAEGPWGFKQRGHRPAVDVVSGSKQKSGRELMLAWPGGRGSAWGMGCSWMDLLMPRMWARSEGD